MQIAMILAHASRSLAFALVLGLAAAPTLMPAATFAQDGVLTVSGELTYRERIALPQGAIARVAVLDVSRADAPSDTIAAFGLQPEGVPLPFTLDVTRDALAARGRYALRATIREGDGTLLWTTDSFITIDPTGDDADLGTIVMARAATGDHAAPDVFRCDETALLVAFEGDTALLTRQGGPHHTQRLERERTASGARFASADGTVSFWIKGETARLIADETERDCTKTPQSDFLTGGSWVVEDIDAKGVIDNSHGTMTFGADGRLSGRAGCNDYSGEWTATGNALETSRIAKTSKACLPALARQETAFMDILTGAARFEFTPTAALVVLDGSGRRIVARRP